MRPPAVRGSWEQDPLWPPRAPRHSVSRDPSTRLRPVRAGGVEAAARYGEHDVDERTNLPQPPDETASPLRLPTGAAARVRAGGASVVLAARGLVVFELAQWPQGDAGELQLAVERLAHQGRQLEVPVEALIVELKQLVEAHASRGRPEHDRRALREQLVSVLIEAYYRASR